jgi:hypothetical protein
MLLRSLQLFMRNSFLSRQKTQQYKAKWLSAIPVPADLEFDELKQRKCLRDSEALSLRWSILITLFSTY